MTETKVDFSNKIILQTKKVEITQDWFDNLLVTALEGGSNYWYWLKTEEFEQQFPSEMDQHLTTALSQEFFTNPEFKLNVYDYEDRDTLLGTVTQESILKAFEKTANQRAGTFHNFETENYDADDADYVFQLAVMGEIQFG